MDLRPLKSVRSLKVKLSILIVAAVFITATFSVIGQWLGWPVWIRPVLSGLISLAMVHILAKGTTYPLRQMTKAAQEMASGDYQQRVDIASADEVGQLGESFNLMVSELAEVERQRKELIANVSHELRTPITAVQMNLENLVDGVTEWDTGRGQVMLAQTTRLSRLVSQLLDLARLESGSAPLHKQMFSVPDLLDEVRAEADLQNRNVEVATAAPETLQILGDAERLHQLLANLVENAIRHSPNGGIVKVVATPLGKGVRIEVADRGPGIKPEERERVFERFHRADTDRSARKGGSGLGLSICRWITELHGGTIAATVHNPSGCRMVVCIPA